MLDVVIVSYRCRDLLFACLESLREIDGDPKLGIHVIDNDSRDGTAEMVTQEFPEVRLTASGLNLGFAKATNIGIQAGSSPLVLALNPDTRVSGDALRALVERMESQPEIGMCGPRLELEDGTMDHAGRRSFPTITSSLGHFSGVGRRRKSGKLAAYRAPEVESGPVDAVNGAFMLMRRAALHEVGTFDEGYWMYMEDLDLCYRFAQAGWITWYEPSVTVTHVKSGSAGERRTPRLNFAFHYGMYRFYAAHYAPSRNRFVNAVVVGGIAAKLALSVTRNALARAQ